MSNTTQQPGKSQSPSSRTRDQRTNGTSGKPRGKSQFAQKSRSKPHTKPVVKSRGPVNTYTSVCCSLPASKPACIKVDKKKALEQSLGTWRCSGCRKACKVTVSKAKGPEVTAPAGVVAGIIAATEQGAM